jgi:3-phenylpropionate/cinnamic acid dioxygenase small subunit
MTLDTTDKLAIHELLSKAAYAYDARDLSMLEASFSESASFSMRIAGGDLIGPFQGREAIIAMMAGAMDAQTDVRRHVVSNLFFDEAAVDVTVISNLTLFATENGDTKLLCVGVYRDAVVLEDGVWKVLGRHLELDAPH